VAVPVSTAVANQLAMLRTTKVDALEPEEVGTKRTPTTQLCPGLSEVPVHPSVVAAN
jgi:hypothetical protein